MALIKEKFITGSSLVYTVKPNDKDIVCLFNTREDMDKFIKTNNINFKEAVSLDSDMRCISCYNDMGKINYICTDDLELFYRFKAFSGLLMKLQIKDRKKRVDLCAACLYNEPPKF